MKILVVALLLVGGCSAGPMFEADSSECDIVHPGFTEHARDSCVGSLQQGSAPFATIDLYLGPDSTGERSIMLVQTDRRIEAVVANGGAETAHTEFVAMIVRGPGSVGREITLSMEDGSERFCESSLTEGWQCSE